MTYEFRQGGQVGRNIYCGPNPEDEIAVAIGPLGEASEWAARIVHGLKVTHGSFPMAFVRWRSGDSREGRVLPPMSADHPAFTDPCPACRTPLGDGRPVQLLAIGPTDDEDRARHTNGAWYSALALLFHTACLGAEVPA